MCRSNIVGRAAIPHRHPHTADNLTRPPLAHVECRTQVSDSLSLGNGRHYFFVRRSFSAALSSMASASSFFSLAFSVSNPFRRLASETSSPPWLGFPIVEARLADPVLAAQIGRLHSGLVFLQDVAYAMVVL
jgi:hypothetical protein